MFLEVLNALFLYFERRFRASHIIIITNLLGVSSGGIKRVGCALKYVFEKQKHYASTIYMALQRKRMIGSFELRTC